MKKILNNINLNNLRKLKIEWFIIIIFFIILGYVLYTSYTRQREPLVGQVKRAVRGVERAGKKIEVIPRELSKVGNQIGDVSKTVGREIDSKLGKFFKEIDEFVTGKIARFFTSLLRAFKTSFVDPILALFIAFGNVFVQLFKILRKIVDKIISLPNCMPFYLISGTYQAVRSFFKSIIPSIIWNFFQKIFKFIGRFTRPTINWLISYDKIKKRCYNFNVNDQISSMGTGFKRAGKKFKNDFGRMRGVEV
jgi:hypothetical protein